VNQLLLHFSYLQVLDFLTTIAFMINGVKEANPLVRFALRLGPSPISGLIVVKVLAVLLGIYCWRMGRQRLLSRINIVFAMVIAWNLVALIVGTLALRAL
jgi:F0F1-type ATP synthase membrane subunit a